MPVLQWSLLFLLSLLLSLFFLLIHLPGALLLGSMIVGIIFSMRGSSLRPPRCTFLAAQAILGCMIAQHLTGSILTTLAAHWSMVIVILLVTLISSAVIGWLLVRYSNLPGNTGAWGSSPGGAAAMVAMAQDYGADIRLVAFMQYLRVLMVVGAAALVTRFVMGDQAQTVNQQIVWFPPLSSNLLSTILLAAVAGIAGRLLRIPSGVMLLPMLAGALLNAGGVMVIELPEWLLAIAYMAIGWQIGLGFDKKIFLMALRPLPQILLSIFSLMAICAAMAWGMAHYMQIDFLTAYLATSPGGVDSVAVIAAGSHADMALIMTMQTLRLFSILLTGPAVARFISTYAPRQPT
ncbi:AbrB family transcriptional regulator [Salmonella enterica subsp. indica]|uniref:AbrB family transcriptional regulator n=5 Tax=Salmonella enterica TaxID=28901 RepID=A0A5Y2QIT2_SALER|nr:AbrB family transcriptional regulator [Salmonella enterica]EBH9037591.1 AbrB family transcriptional regulator [Salmonella enterica subsp. indica serovar 11:b:e,n,x]EBP3213644.1 AbrB family transcriptional regulator [Salmonella enterica subsp. arizonae]ECI8271882.1 AbrB family transcriptional regulator [Salmonella enterica subsp. enterica]EDR2773123.1 AbrB family transcriptional regulator [Salmonella enterica subsp. enterica serovar Oslo]EEC4250234.1 AbrB family transcriptional regulator [Sa